MRDGYSLHQIDCTGLMRKGAGQCWQMRNAAKSLFESGAFNRSATSPCRSPILLIIYCLGPLGIFRSRFSGRRFCRHPPPGRNQPIHSRRLVLWSEMCEAHDHLKRPTSSSSTSVRRSTPTITSLLSNVWQLQCKGMLLTLRIIEAVEPSGRSLQGVALAHRGKRLRSRPSLLAPQLPKRGQSNGVRRNGPGSHRRSGAFGLRVSPFCLGAMTFGEDLGSGFGGSVTDSEAMLSHYLEHWNKVETSSIPQTAIPVDTPKRSSGTSSIEARARTKLRRRLEGAAFYGPTRTVHGFLPLEPLGTKVLRVGLRRKIPASEVVAQESNFS
jgi:hypothetical protein